MNSVNNIQLQATVEAWLKKFNLACQQSTKDAWLSLFEDDAHWREVVALTWAISTTSGRGAVAQNLASGIQYMQAKNFEINAFRQAPRIVERAGERVIEAILRFETRIGEGAALVRFKYPSDNQFPTQAWTFHTTLESIHGHEESTIKAKKADPVINREFNGPNWLDRRTQSQLYEDREPAVLIVGGGHAGLSVAARLGQLDVDCLVID